MIKKILIAFLVLIVVGLIALYFSINSIVGGSVTKAFNKFGPEITGTQTYIKSTGVNVFDGTISINGLFIGNPEGFEKPSAMECGEIYIDIEPSSLLSDRIEVNEIKIVAPKFTYDQNLATNNLSKLKSQVDSNMKKYKTADETPAETPQEPADAEQPSKTLILHKLIVSDGEVDLSVNLALVKANQVLALPEINEDFGGKGVTPAEATDYILSIVLEKVVVVAAEMVQEIANDPNAVLDTATKSLDNAGDAVDKAGQAIKGLFD
ncbi:hypothetical protein [Cerasicoccus maritimus]|uniref:hypothetical protein n=1 Tax=Cerasicoccus maritimus TaxID=490089 RepID=UPI002852D086|nr:hypothetical protein [Cerasicoccus maritimus]